MASRPLHLADKSIEQNLLIATLWIDLSGILDILAPAERGGRQGPGRPVVLGQYTTRGLLIALCEIALSKREMSYTELTRTLWRVYDNEIRSRLGMPDICDPKSVAALDAASKPNATAAELREGMRAHARIRTRIIEAFEKATKPIDDNVAPAGRRHTNAELAKLRRANPRLAEKAARDDVINRLVQGSLYAANSTRHADIDPRDLKAGILKGWVGDVAIDETDHDYAIATKGRGKKLKGANSYHPISELAEFFKKPGSRLQWPTALGLTFAIAVSRPEGRRVPSVALAGAIAPPSAGSVEGALICLDAITAADIRPKTRSNAHSYVSVDMAYPYGTQWASEMLKRNLSHVVKYRSDASRIHPLTSTDAPSGIVSAHLFNGVPVCPGISGRALAGITYEAPKQHYVNGAITYKGKDVYEHQRITERLRPVLMPRHGRPERAPDRRPGRPRNGVQPREDIYKIRVMCPAVAGQARCPLVQESMEHPPAEVPSIPDPPLNNPPPTCRNSFTTLRMTAAQFKDYQHRQAGSMSHEFLYTSARSRDEGYHSALYQQSTGNLVRGNIKPWKNAFLSIAVAMAVGATNIKIMDRWDVVVKLNGGKAPVEPGANLERIRRNVLAEYRATHPNVP